MRLFMQWTPDKHSSEGRACCTHTIPGNVPCSCTGVEVLDAGVHNAEEVPVRVPAAQGGLPGSSQPAEAPALSQRQPITCQCAIERSTSHDNSHGLSVAHGALHVLTIWPDLGSLRFHISQQNLDYKECASWNAATFTAGGWGGVTCQHNLVAGAIQLGIAL